MQTPAQRASALVDAGVELSHRGRFEEAADQFVLALALDPNLAEAHYLLGLVRQHDGRLDAALQSFRRALAIHPAYGAAQTRVCELDTTEARKRESGYDKALASCRRAAGLDPLDPEPHFHIGWSLAKLGDHAAATAEFQAVLRLDSKFPGVRFELAMSRIALQDTDGAMLLLREVAAAEPDNSGARFQLGAALVKKGDCRAALPWLQAAPESVQKHYLLAGCFKKMNRAEDAAAALAKADQLREGAEARMQAKFLAALAHRKAESGELDQAIASYRAALALVKDTSVAVDLAVALLRKGEPLEVVRLLAGETLPLARYQVALAQVKLGHMSEARTILDLVLRENPRFVEAWYQKGIVLLALGQAKLAEAALRTAVKLRPDEAVIRLALAETLQKLGDTGESAEQRRVAARLSN